MEVYSHRSEEYVSETKPALQVSFLFDKYKTFEYVNPITLFDIDLRIATQQCKCPYCHCRLYEMRNKPFFFCKSTKHKNRFIIGKDKIK